MLTTHELDLMRDTSTSALSDTCTIKRTPAEATLNLTTGDLTPSAASTIFTGACRVRPQGDQENDAQVGDLHETLSTYVGTLPHDADDIRVDDVLTIVTSTDAEMVGRTFRLTHVGWSSWQIDRRIGLEDREQPQGIEGGS